MTTSKGRDYKGKYAFEGALSALCRCGHLFGDHHVLAPHRCTGTNGQCGCEKFRRMPTIYNSEGVPTTESR